MAADHSKDELRVIVAYLDDTDVDLDAAKRLVAEPSNRLAAFHLQQAAEKLVKALRLHRRLHVTADHSIARLLEELPHEDAWRTRLGVLEPLTTYATAFRYPSPTGKRKEGLSSEEVLAWIKIIAELSAEGRRAVGA